MRIPYRFAPVFCAASLALLLSSTSAVAAFAYIGNARDNAISVIDTATNSVVATISLPVNVSGIAVSSDGKRVYAVKWPSGLRHRYHDKRLGDRHRDRDAPVLSFCSGNCARRKTCFT